MAKENTLIYRAQTGDEGAFADLMRAYHAFVYTIAIGIVDNPHDAEEVVQDAFLNAYQGLRQLEDATKFKGWLAEITRNRARNWLRKQQGETVSLDDVSEDMLQMEDSPDERLTQLEQRELIRRTMETLPQKDRDIARAFYLEGVSYDELIRAHGLSYNAIALRLFRIKRKLSKQLRYLLTRYLRFSRTDTQKTLYGRSNCYENWNGIKNNGWCGSTDCVNFYRLHWDTPYECTYSCRTRVFVAMGGWHGAPTK